MVEEIRFGKAVSRLLVMTGPTIDWKRVQQELTDARISPKREVGWARSDQSAGHAEPFSYPQLPTHIDGLYILLSCKYLTEEGGGSWAN